MSIEKLLILNDRTTPSETVPTGKAYLWLENDMLHMKDDNQVVQNFSFNSNPEQVRDIVAAMTSSANNKLSIVYDDNADTLVFTVNESNIVHQNISGAGTNTHAQIDTHIANTSNPHSVTKAQVGLGNVPNVDATIAANITQNSTHRFVSDLQIADWDSKVASNAAITGATKLKITYDSKGLVTSGADAVIDDLSDVVISSPQLDEVLSFNGTQWVNKKTTPQVNAGAGVVYFFTNTASGISTYDFISKTPDSTPEQDESVTVTNGSALIEDFIADSDIAVTSINAGIWEFNLYGYVSSTLNVSHFIAEVYKRTAGGAETLLFSVDSDEINSTSIALYNANTVQPAFACNATDRIVVKIYGATDALTARTIHLIHSGSDHYSHFHTPLVIKHNDLAGLQGGSSNEYYHLTQTQNSGLTGSANTALHFHDSDRNRSNHTGTQLAATISNFASAVLSTVLTGLSLVTSTAITAADSVLSAFGKLQAQITTLINRNVNTGTGLSGGGNLSTDRTISIANTTVTAATYGEVSTFPVFTVNAQGQITSASNNNVTSALLTGISLVAGDVAATDTILGAIGKLAGTDAQWIELINTTALNSSSNVTLTNVTEFQFGVTSGLDYYFEFTVIFQSTAGGTGFVLSIGTPNGATGTIAAQVNIPVAVDGTGALFTGSITSLGDVVIGTGVQTTNTDFVATVKGTFNCTGTGLLLPQFRSETNGTQVTFRPRSVLLARIF